MSKPMTRFLVIALLLAGLAGNSLAQQPASADGWAGVVRLAPGTEIRVGLSGGRTVRGHLQNVTSDSLVINTTASQEALLRVEIKRVDWKGKGRRGRNAVIGLLIGAGGGLAIGAAIDHHDHNQSFNIVPNAGKIVITPLGAIIGTLVGLLIPSGGWREIYRAP